MFYELTDESSSKLKNLVVNPFSTLFYSDFKVKRYARDKDVYVWPTLSIINNSNQQVISKVIVQYQNIKYVLQSAVRMII